MSDNVKVFLKPKEEQEIKQGFPWVFDNEIFSIQGEAPDGSLVDVFTKAGMYLGSGIINQKSKITVRFLTNDREFASKGITAFDENFFKEKILNALSIRYQYYKKEDSYRLVFAEADFLPGLIVERYCDTKKRVFLVIQFLSLAVEIFRDKIIKVLQDVCTPFGIYERSDVSVREKEGLEQKSGWIGAEHIPQITIVENGVLLNVDLQNGQKTGYFLDQKFNRKSASAFAKGKRVLDTFTHTGAFGLNCALNGAKQVTCVDISEEACEVVKSNISINGMDKKVSVICKDVFDLLKEYEQNNEKFDLIILDPPAFAKSAKAFEKAYGGYKEINLRAMKILNPNGILVTCSCSHFMDTESFINMVMHASTDAKRRVQILEKRGAGPDHPVLLGYPNSEYLKCVITKVL